MNPSKVVIKKQDAEVAAREKVTETESEAVAIAVRHAVDGGHLPGNVQLSFFYNVKPTNVEVPVAPSRYDFSL